MTSEPRVSVIMPAFNARDTIERALRSVLAQTCPGLEVVVVDDGSTDDTAAVVERVAADLQVAVRVIAQPHGGLASARNRGLASALGDFIGFVDADDTVEPTMYEQMLACADSNGADFVVCEYVGVDDETGEVRHIYVEGDTSLYGGSVSERPGLLSAIGPSACNKLIHRSVFERSGGIEFPEGRDFEDLATMYRLVGEARRIEKVAERLYLYRQGRSTSIMGACDERYLHILDALALTNQHFRRAGTFDSVRDELETINFIHLIVGRYDDLFRFGSRSVRHEFAARAFEHMDSYFPGWRTDQVIRATSGRAAKHAVSTRRWLLTLYTDLTARPSSS